DHGCGRGIRAIRGNPFLVSEDVWPDDERTARKGALRYYLCGRLRDLSADVCVWPGRRPATLRVSFQPGNRRGIAIPGLVGPATPLHLVRGVHHHCGARSFFREPFLELAARHACWRQPLGCDNTRMDDVFPTTAAELRGSPGGSAGSL